MKNKLGDACKTFKSKVLGLYEKDKKTSKDKVENKAEEYQEQEQGMDMTSHQHGMKGVWGDFNPQKFANPIKF